MTRSVLNIWLLPSSVLSLQSNETAAVRGYENTKFKRISANSEKPEMKNAADTRVDSLCAAGK